MMDDVGDGEEESRMEKLNKATEEDESRRENKGKGQKGFYKNGLPL